MTNEDLLIKRALSEVQAPAQEVFHNVVVELDESGQPSKTIPADVMLVAKLDELCNIMSWIADTLNRIAPPAPASAAPQATVEESDPALD